MDPPRPEGNAVIRTNDEALDCRIALDRTGLLIDPFVRLFPQYSSDITSPLFLRGSFIRTKVVDNMMIEAVEGRPFVQVVVLGAGFDTRWHRIFSSHQNITAYAEVDFAEVIKRKRRYLEGAPATNDPRYKLIECDITLNLVEKLQSNNVSSDIPLVVVAECCLMYISQRQIKSLLDSLVQAFPSIQMILYEPLFISDDPFTTQMVQNLRSRNIDLDPLYVSSISQLPLYFEESSFQTIFLDSMKNSEHCIYFNEANRSHLNNLIALDEYEEWTLISDHYYFAILQRHQFIK